jgi:hypothetical protein
MKTKLALIITLAGCFLCGNIFAAGDPANLGNAYISLVTAVNGNCVQSTIDGNTQKWDIQAGGTYEVTLTGVNDCANYGSDPTIQVIVKNSAGGNICVAIANQTAAGVYVFQVTLTTQCLTLPILYCTSNCDPGTGMFARDALAGHEGHLRTATFDGDCNVTGEDTTCQGAPPKASITACKFYDKNANGIKDVGEDYLAGWPIGICPLDGAPEQQTQVTGISGCVTWTNLTTPGDYTVTEANANETNWFHSPDPMPPPLIVNGTSTIVFPTVGETGTRTVRQLLHIAEWWADLGLLVQQERQQDSDRLVRRKRNDPVAERRDRAELVRVHAKRERVDPYLHQQLLPLQNLVAGRHRDEHGLHAVGAVGNVEAGPHRQLRVCGWQRV